MKPSEMLGKVCNACGRPAEYFVKDGDLGDLACARHLVDAIETAINESDLTVDDDPLQVWALRSHL